MLVLPRVLLLVFPAVPVGKSVIQSAWARLLHSKAACLCAVRASMTALYHINYTTCNDGLLGSAAYVYFAAMSCTETEQRHIASGAMPVESDPTTSSTDTEFHLKQLRTAR